MSAVRGGTIKRPQMRFNLGNNVTWPLMFALLRVFSYILALDHWFVEAFRTNAFEAFNYIVCLSFLLVLMKLVNLTNQFHTDRKVTFHL